MKKYIYLISPPKIFEKKFYIELEKILTNKNIKYFQLRLKAISQNKLLKIAKKIKKITKKKDIKFIINDKPLVAKKVNADGCHIGQKDIGIENCRKILGKNKIIGVTCHNSKKKAIAAHQNGANYIAFGSFFRSKTKKKSIKANLRILRWAKKKINIPIIAIVE